MSLRKNRIHQCGFSNIDFRTKRDIESLSIFQPWKVPKDFGTMTSIDYKPSYTEGRIIDNLTSNIQSLKNQCDHGLDPKLYATAQFYHKNRISLNMKPKFEIERIAQLDESALGKDIFTGDSMMIADINKYRRERKKKRQRYLDEKAKMKRKLRENITKDKEEKNKEAYTETQLVNIEAEETLENKVDIKKLQEIRLALRRRYASRTNFRKIFKEWDHSIAGEISVYDAYNMINSLSIPINYNETRALLASSNTRGTETLDLKEFMHLIFSDNPALNVDLKKIKYKEEKLYEAGAQVENLKKNMMINILEVNKTDDINFIKTYLRTRVPRFMKNIKEIQERIAYEKEVEEKGIVNPHVIDDNPIKLEDVKSCNKEVLKEALERFHFPERYTKPQVIEAIYNSYGGTNEVEMDVKKFLNDILTEKDANNFFDFPDNYLNRITQKINETEKKISTTAEYLEADNQKKKDLNKEYLDEIKKSNRGLLPKIPTPVKGEINNTKPSTDFIDKVFAKRRENFEALNKAELVFSPHPSIIKENRGKTRFGANPPHKDTFYIIGTEFDKDRYRGNSCEIAHEDKEKKKKILEGRVKVLKKYRENIGRSSKNADIIFDQKEMNTMLKRAKRLYGYELFNKNRNELIE